MRKLAFEYQTKEPINKIWSLLSNVNNYHLHIKYCLRSGLIGNFQEGASWYDWSTVVYVPLKINHKIIKIVPHKKIEYKIELPIGDIWQTLSISTGKQTKVRLQIVIDFPNRFVNQTIGSLVYYRNRKMLEGTIENFKKSFSA